MINFCQLTAMRYPNLQLCCLIYILKTVPLIFLFYSIMSIKLFKVWVGNPTRTIFKLVSPKLECLSCLIIVKVVGNEVLKLGNVGRRPMVDVLLGYNIWNCMRTEFKPSKWPTGYLPDLSVSFSPGPLQSILHITTSRVHSC